MTSGPTVSDEGCANEECSAAERAEHCLLAARSHTGGALSPQAAPRPSASADQLFYFIV